MSADLPQLAEQSEPAPFLTTAAEAVPVSAGSDIRASTEALRVLEVAPGRDSRWESFVRKHPDGSIYHHSLWLKVIEQAYAHKAIAFVCEDAKGRLRGVLPLCQTNGFLTGKRLVSLPHTPLAGPLAYGRESTTALLGAAIDRVKQRGDTFLELKLSPESLQPEPPISTLFWDNTYVLVLPGSVEALRFGDSRNHGRLKWSIQKASKLAVRVRWAETKQDLRHWYELYLQTMRRHVVPPRPYRFFEIAWSLLHEPGMMRLLLAEKSEGHRDVLLSGSIFLGFGQTVFYAFNGRRQTEQSFRSNDLIQWTAIHYFCEQGFRRYDFGEVEAKNQGLAEFKLKWGAKPIRLHRSYYPEIRGLQLSGKSTLLRQVANVGWRLLPLRATAFLGDCVYRYL
jgi:hypothetical protein